MAGQISPGQGRPARGERIGFRDERGRTAAPAAAERERHATVARKGEKPRVRVAEDEGQRALLVDGVVQSVAVEGPTFHGPGYWPAMLPDVRPRQALLL